MKFLRDNILSWIVLLGGLAYGLAHRSDLPSQLATHFDLRGQPNASSPRDLTLLFLPVIGLLTIVFVQVLVHFSPKDYNMSENRRVIPRIYFALAALVTTLHVGIVNTALHPSGAGMNFYIGLGMGLFLVGLGNYMGKTERNFFIGIRTPWTLASEKNWHATHRYAGKMMVAFGLALLILNFREPNVVVTLATVVAALGSPVLYSFLYYSRRERG